MDHTHLLVLDHRPTMQRSLTASWSVGVHDIKINSERLAPESWRQEKYGSVQQSAREMMKTTTMRMRSVYPTINRRAVPMAGNCPYQHSLNWIDRQERRSCLTY